MGAEHSDQVEPRRRLLRKVARSVVAAILLGLRGSAVTGPSDQQEARRRHLRILAASTTVAAAILLCLSAVANAAPSDQSSTLVLEESLNGQVQCVSPDATCSINKYGENGAPGPSFIAPGEQHVTTVELTNAGTLTASSLDMSAGLCQNQGANGVVAPSGDLCGTVTVMVLCTTGGATFSYGPTTLTTFAQSGTHTVNSGLAPSTSTSCTFTVTYPANAAVIFSTSAVQPITWTLNAAEAPPTTTPPTTAPPTTAPPVTAPPATAPPTTALPTTAPPSAAVTPPSSVAPPTSVAAPPSLAFTGTDALVLLIAGLVLFAIGAVLFWFSRRGVHRYDGESSPAGDSR